MVERHSIMTLPCLIANSPPFEGGITVFHKVGLYGSMIAAEMLKWAIHHSIPHPLLRVLLSLSLRLKPLFKWSLVTLL